VLRNGPMARLTLGLVPVAVLTGMAIGTQFLFIDTFLGLGNDYPTIMLLSAPMALLGVPFWGFLCVRYERHRVLAVSLTLGAISYLGLALVAPGPGAAPMVMVLYPLCMLAVTGTVALYPMIGDVADYGRLQSGEDLSGLYASIFTFVQISLRTVSSAAGIALIGWLGFHATATTQTASGAFAIRLISVILPAAGLALASLLYWTYPLTRARVEEIREQLLAREASAKPVA
jgi:Na+/melibiose symporter-like transporter